MATARMLSTTIAIDAQLAQLSERAEWMYIKCIPHLDRDGMITGEPMALLGIVSPMRFSEVHAAMPGLVDEWVQVGLVVRFASPVGPVLFFKGFLKQQSLKYSRERPSQFPCPPGYMRTSEGLKAASAVPWVEVVEPVPAVSTVESGKKGTFAGFSGKNPDSAPQQQQQQQQQQEQQQQQQQQQQQDEPGAAAAAALEEFGITGAVLEELADCPEELVRGWIAYAGTQPKLNNPRGYVIKRLRSREPPPALPAAAAEDDADSYEALKRRYVPDGWEGVVRY